MGKMAALVGQKLAGFRLTEMLGKGGMAAVFRGENLLDASIVRAIKVVQSRLSEDPEFTKRFAEEARVLEKLQHPNIVRFHGARWEGERLLMELELLQGQSLAARLRGADPGTLPLEQVTGWFLQASAGLAEAHRQGFVHRDIKPENIFLSHDETVKILDFGIARALDDAERASSVTKAGTVPGTPAYLAPEVCRNGEPSRRSDVYAMGVSMVEVLLGYHPLQPPDRPKRTGLELMFAQVKEALPDLRQQRPDVSPELDQVLRRATAKDPAKRHADAEHFHRELSDCSTPGSAAAEVSTPAPTSAAMETPGQAVPPLDTPHALDTHPALATRLAVSRPWWLLPLLLVGALLGGGAVAIFMIPAGRGGEDLTAADLAGRGTAQPGGLDRGSAQAAAAADLAVTATPAGRSRLPDPDAAPKRDPTPPRRRAKPAGPAPGNGPTARLKSTILYRVYKNISAFKAFVAGNQAPINRCYRASMYDGTEHVNIVYKVSLSEQGRVERVVPAGTKAISEKLLGCMKEALGKLPWPQPEEAGTIHLGFKSPRPRPRAGGSR